MLDFLEQIPAEWRPFALIIFVAAGAVGGWFSYFRGKKAGPESPKVQEFYAAGMIADMGPVKELVEQTGLLFQQQVKTNILLERLALSAEGAVNEWAEQREQQDREEEIERRVAERLADEARHRPPPRKTT